MDGSELSVGSRERKAGRGGPDIGDEYRAFHAPSLQISTRRINCTKGMR
jgi:hypothetical protein